MSKAEMQQKSERSVRLLLRKSENIFVLDSEWVLLLLLIELNCTQKKKKNQGSGQKKREI